MSEREEFEAWARKDVSTAFMLEDDDEEAQLAHHVAWQAWQAARATPPAEGKK